MPVVHLTDRALIRAKGLDARSFLHHLVTCNIETLEVGGSRFGALLTPQGKIISDFLVYGEGEDSFLIDAPRERAEDLKKRLLFHRLRAKVQFDALDDMAVAAVFGGDAAPAGAQVFADPRVETLGQRAVLPLAEAQAIGGDLAAYDAHRIALAVPTGGADFAYNETFPHEADMDQLNGVDFKKGCFVGQEVVSRMQYRSTARNRAVEAVFAKTPETGVEIMAGEKSVGRISSVAGGQGIAMVRIDRAFDARTDGVPLKAGDIDVELRLPPWATFSMDWERK